MILRIRKQVARTSSSRSLHFPLGCIKSCRQILLVQHFERALLVTKFQNLDNEMVIFLLNLPLLEKVIFVGFRPQMRKILALGRLLVYLALDVEKVIEVVLVVVMIGEQLREVMWIRTMSVSCIHFNLFLIIGFDIFLKFKNL